MYVQRGVGPPSPNSWEILSRISQKEFFLNIRPPPVSLAPPPFEILRPHSSYTRRSQISAPALLTGKKGSEGRGLDFRDAPASKKVMATLSRKYILFYDHFCRYK